MNGSSFSRDFSSHKPPYFDLNETSPPPPSRPPPALLSTISSIRSPISTVSSSIRPPISTIISRQTPPQTETIRNRASRARAEENLEASREVGRDSQFDRTANRGATESRGSTMGDYPSLDGFPVQTWGGVGSARLLQTRASLPPMTLSSKDAYREQRKRDGSRFLHSSGGGRPSAYRTSSNMTSGVGKFHLMMADHMFQRRLETHKNMCVDDFVRIKEVVDTPKTVKTTFTIDIADAPVSMDNKSINQTLKDAEAVLDL